jgi:hypothetical protein
MFDPRIGRYVGGLAWDGFERWAAEFDDPRDWGKESVVFSADQEDLRHRTEAGLGMTITTAAW